MAAKKANGASLGNPTNLAGAGSIGRQALVESADAFKASLLPIVQALQSSGHYPGGAHARTQRAQSARCPRRYSRVRCGRGVEAASPDDSHSIHKRRQPCGSRARIGSVKVVAGTRKHLYRTRFQWTRLRSRPRWWDPFPKFEPHSLRHYAEFCYNTRVFA